MIPLSKIGLSNGILFTQLWRWEIDHLPAAPIE